MPAAKKQPVKHPGTTTPISAGMFVSEIIGVLPEAGPLLGEYGLHCFSCSQNDRETLADGCASHGFGEEEVAALVTELNTLHANRPPRPQTLILTLAAAKALNEVMAGEGKAGQILVVGVDESGSFCLEFAEKTPLGAKIFTHREVPAVTVAALPETLERIGGATIDCRDGRFKLDLPEALATPTCGCNGGRCSCADRS